MRNIFLKLLTSLIIFLLSLEYLLYYADKSLILLNPFDLQLFLIAPTLFIQNGKMFLISCFNILSLFCLVYFIIGIFKKYKSNMKNKNIQ